MPGALGVNAAVVKLLLKAPGLDVNDNSAGVSALFIAELDDYKEIAELLRKAGAIDKRRYL